MSHFDSLIDSIVDLAQLIVFAGPDECVDQDAVVQKKVQEAILAEKEILEAEIEEENHEKPILSKKKVLSK